MITAVDSNVLIDVFGADPQFGPLSRASLRRCLHEGALIACGAVWAEVMAAFPDATATSDAMLRLPIAYSAASQGAAIRAGVAWRVYRAGGGPRTRIAADFLVGAHALEQADRLLTRDRRFHRTAFEGLAIVDPTG